jgi:WD40 repeat protein
VLTLCVASTRLHSAFPIFCTRCEKWRRQRLVLCSSDRCVLCFAARCEPTFFGRCALHRYVQFAPNGRFILAATLDNVIRLWNCASSKCAKQFRGHKNEKFCVGYVWPLRFVFLLFGNHEVEVVSPLPCPRAVLYSHLPIDPYHSSAILPFFF